jgi:hypothetical protein
VPGWGTPEPRSKLRDLGAWFVERWRGVLISFVLAPVLGPAIALYCLVEGLRAVDRSWRAELRWHFSLGGALGALIAAVLPAAVYGCTVWGLQAAVSPSDWVGWFIVLLVAGLAGLVSGVLPAFYVFGYSFGVAQAEAEAAHRLYPRPRPPMSLRRQMLRPFRRSPP